MKKLFAIRQNNSGGSWSKPAVTIWISAENEGVAAELLSKHGVSLCGTSGRYADYDDCGCCPCCGHRWEGLEESLPDDYRRGYLFDNHGLSYLGEVGNAYISESGIIIGDSIEKLNVIRNEVTAILSATKQ